MSHFSVLVVGNDVEKQLQPFHEFECTGTDDEYVQDVDITEDARKEYLADTSRQLCAPDGTLFSPYDDRFYRDPTSEETKEIGPIAGTGGNGKFSWTSKDWGDGRGYRTKIRFVPNGYEEIEVPRNETQSFAEFIEDYYGLKPRLNGNDAKHGWIELDANGEVVRAIDRTNPNKKWDWWQIGGRFSGLFSPDYDPAKDSANQETCFLCRGTGKRLDMAVENGCNGCKGTGVREKWPTQWKPHSGDQITIAQLRENLEALRSQAEQEAAQLYDKARPLIDDDFVPWPQMRERHRENIEAARTEYRTQPAVERFRQADLTWESPEDFLITRDEFLQQARLRAGRTFAIVKDGQWYEKGRMGWFGCVADEKPAEDWAQQYWNIVDSLAPDTLVTVVDCHI